jgi:hypothetical protein
MILPDEIHRDRPFADPDKAARKLIEIANSVEAYMDGRIPIEVINGPTRRRQPVGIWRGARPRPRERLAVAAQIRGLCEVHAGRRRAVRLKAAK